MPTVDHTPRHYIGLFTEDGLDQICETPAQAADETKDLRAMGCTVNRYTTTDETTLYAIEMWIRDGRSFAVARGRVEAGHLHPDTVAEAAEAEAAEAASKARKAAEAAKAGTLPPARLNGRKVYKAETHANGFSTVATRPVGGDDGAAYCVATWWPELGTCWAWGHYCRTRAEVESIWAEVSARNAARGQAYTTPGRFPEGTVNAGDGRVVSAGPRSLSAAATPDHLKPGYKSHDGTPAYTTPRTASRVAMGRAMADDVATIARAAGGFPLWAFAADRVATAIDDSMALGLFDDCGGCEELPAGLESFT